MATMLEKYLNILNGLMKRDTPFTAEEMFTYQEVLYRIEVLQVCQTYAKNAPINIEIPNMIKHYQMIDVYFENLKLERKYGMKMDEEIQKKQDTAHQNLCLVINDYRKRFGSFAPQKEGQYKSEIGKVINTFLPAWIGYRNQYIQITSEVSK